MRLFVAVWPTPAVVEELGALPRPAAPGLRWTTADQWHVTLRFLGDADPGEAVDALARLAGASTEAVLGPATAELGRGVLTVPVAGVDELAAAVIAVTAEVGEPPEQREFTGHLTLARSRGPLPDGAVGQPCAGRFPVDEVALVASRTEPGGARYEVIGRFALG